MSKTRDTGYLNNIIQYSSSSVSFVSGSTVLSSINTSGNTKYGITGSNTHQFTGSLLISGSSTSFQINNNTLFVSSSGNVGIGTTNMINKLQVNVSSNTAYSTTSTGNVLTIYNTSLTTGGYAGIDFISEPTTGNSGRAAINMTVTGNGTADLAFSTRNTDMGEKMRITSAGNIGIGTSDIVSTNLTGAVTIKKTYSGDTTNGATTQAYYANQSALFLFGRNSGISIISNNAEEGHIVFGNASTNAYASIKTGTASTSTGGDMYFQVGSNTERMRITTAGNVGIGISNPSALLTLLKDNNIGINTSDGSDNGYLALCGAGADGSARGGHIYLSGNERGADPGTVILSAGDVTGGAVVVRTGPGTERMRVNASGNLLVGKTATGISTVGCEILGNGSAVFAFAVSNNEAVIFNNITTGTTYQLDFRTNAIERGSINVTDAGTSYATTSDYRVKEDFKDFNGLEKLTNIKVYDFKFKDLDERMDGVIAHELQEVIPYAVTGEKDGTKFQSVDYSRIVPVLIKSLQELKAENDTLKEILQRNNIQ